MSQGRYVATPTRSPSLAVPFPSVQLVAKLHSLSLLRVISIRLKHWMCRRQKYHVHLPEGAVTGSDHQIEHVHAAETAWFQELAEFVKAQGTRAEREVVGLDDEH